ncbi:MAG: DUF3597 domain-containing protein [Chloroflexi bacterium]|nr:DUF3597 domain-containing protein [Chloroflexota bacterium]
MGFFSKILEKLGLKKDEPAPAPAAQAKPAAAPAKPAAEVKAAPAASAAKPKAVVYKEKDDVVAKVEPAKPAAISEVDVVNKLEQLSAGKGLNWKVSIVDLLKLLEIDSSLAARKELAAELNCPADLIGGDYSKMNVWLHKEVLRQVAANGGNIPKELLD